MRVVLPCLLAGIGLLASASTAGAADREPQVAAPSGYVPGEVLVRFKAGVDGSERAAARRKQGARVEDALEVPRVQLLELEPGTSVGRAVAAFERDPRVEYAEPNFPVTASASPDDTYFSQLWGLDSLSDADIDAPEAWDLRTDASTVTVGIADTGVAPDHPDLAAHLVPGNDWVHDDGAATADLDGHGTHVAGTVGAVGNNNRGVPGVAWKVALMPLRVLDNTGTGTFADVANAFQYAGDNGIPVVNASLGGHPSVTQIQTLEASIENSPGTLFVVAAGNEQTDLDAGSPDYPCSLQLANILCVAASDSSDAPASSYTNYGSTSVDIAAPGSGVQSTVPVKSVTWNEHFNGGLADWTALSENGSPVTWAASSAAGDYSPNDSPPGIVDSPAGNYQNNSDTYVRTNAAVGVGSNCDLWFDLKLDVDSAGDDRFLVEVSEAPGGNWTPIYSRKADTNGWDTFAADFKSDSYDFYGRSVYLRFRLKSNGVTTAAGAAVDWVEVICHGGEAYDAFSGTSMAAPHVAGAAALVLAESIQAGDPLTALELKQRLLETGDRLSCWDGLTVTGARLNVARALDPAGSFGDGLESCPRTITRAAPAPQPDPEPQPAPAPPAPPAPSPTPPAGTDTATPTPVDDDPPAVRASAARRYRAATLLRRGLRARIRCDEECRVRTDLLVGRRTAKRLGIRGRRFGSRYVLVGRARSGLSRAGSKTVTTKISRRSRRGLRRARSVRLVLRVLARDEHGNDRVTRRSLTVRR